MNRCGYQIDDLDLSVRVYNLLLRAGITTVPDLGSLTNEELEKIKGLSAKGIQEIKEKLKRFDSLEPEDCPFCGEPPSICEKRSPRIVEYSVACCNLQCPCMPSTGEFNTEKEAIEAWNRRAEQ